MLTLYYVNCSGDMLDTPPHGRARRGVSYIYNLTHTTACFHTALAF